MLSFKGVCIKAWFSQVSWLNVPKSTNVIDSRSEIWRFNISYNLLLRFEKLEI